MKFFSRVFTPTKNRRLNELAGFLLFVSAVLLFLALVSYSPTDPSLNTAASTSGSHGSQSANNWIGLFGAMVSDLLLQSMGICVFLLPVAITLLGIRWFKSRDVSSPGAKALGASILLVFSPALLALLPGHMRWKHAIPVEGLLGRILGDVLLHYFNLIGAYIVAATVVAVALYLSTTFSFSSAQIWMHTRFAFTFALWQRFQDWRAERAKTKAVLAQKKQAQNKEKEALAAREAQRVAGPAVAQRRPQAESVRSGIEREFELHKAEPQPSPLHAMPRPASAIPASAAHQVVAPTNHEPEPPVAVRADLESKARTVLPKIAAGGYKLPPSSLLQRSEDRHAINEQELKELAAVLTEKCAEFDVLGTVTQINPGPVVTTYEFKPEAGVKYSRVTSLCDDLCLAMRAESILIERMAGKSTVGIQVPNHERETIWLREMVESPEFLSTKSKLTLAMGKDINGRIITADLAAMPHLLIAGSTGSGKSVAINAMIMSILYKATPEQVRLILVDPKRLELGVYEGVPHLYVPIITEPKLAANALRNAVREMERRLKVLAAKGVRNIEQYNKLFDKDTPSLFEEEAKEEKPLPYIVIIIDELADLMMLDQSNVEESITRLAQMARAVGIHLVLATQRPSVDVITGLIKANFPSRVSFRVATKIDSRTILDANGAESLLGKGDMLYLPSGSARVNRVHAPYTTEKETHAVVEFWRSQAQAQYDQKFLEAPKDEKQIAAGGGGAGDDDDGDGHDELYHDAVKLVIEFGKASTSLLQRRLRIGYGRAAHLIDLMERDGIVGAADGPKPREVLKRPDWLSEVEEALR
jgi:DNA segregation ATPase FtsK/SpoIIIE, S-DNA-T family